MSKKLRLLTLAVAFAVAMVMAIPAGAAPPSVSITGGGIAQNDNSTNVDHPLQYGVGGFNAKILGNDKVTGQVQLKSIDADTGDLVAQLHGTVVCVQETAGVVADGQGWEIRFTFTDPGLGDIFGSIYVQDNLTGDMIDEVFAFAFLWTEDCGTSDLSVGWEPLIHGDITVH